MKDLSQLAYALSGSQTAQMSKQASQLMSDGHTDVISLAIGEPGFQTPKPVKKAAINAINSNHTTCFFIIHFFYEHLLNPKAM